MNTANNPSNFRNPFRIALASALALSPLIAMNNALACAACGCTLSKDWGTQGVITTPGFTADLSYDYVNQDQQRYGTGTASSDQINALSAAGEEIEDYTTTRTTTASLNYTGGTWGVSAQLPFVDRTHGTFGDTGAYPGTTDYASSSDSGIGDIRLIGRYTGFSADKSAGILAGIKLPTGSTDATFNDGVTPLDRSLQIGTGSTDVILGGYLTGAVEQYGWFAQATVQHAVATKAINGEDYRPGDAISVDTGIRYAKFGAKFTPMLQLNYIHRQPDTGAGATAPDALTGGPGSGGTLVYLAPGALYRVGGGTSVYGFVQLPVYQDVNSLQLTPRYTVTIGIHQTFE
ncbi:MAG TPA: hypothetical protein VMJ33_04670 [Gallionella sp.]|nr:hypothetical protein [Gallionella sp.]